MTVSELNAREEAKAAKSGRRNAGNPEDPNENKPTESVKTATDVSDEQQTGSTPPAYASPASLRLQYEYELERSREVSSSINRLTVTVPILISAICLIMGLVAPMCTEHMPLRLMLVVGISDIIVLLAALTVACTVHFYILNPAPSQPEEKEWLAKMKRDLQRGNNWRAWLVFAATLLIYLSVATTLALLIICILGI